MTTMTISVQGLNLYERDTLVQRLSHMKRNGILREEVEIIEGSTSYEEA